MEVSVRSNAGFTLIEVMVSLTIMALITGIAFTGLSVGMDSWESGSEKIAELDRRYSVERLIQRQLAQADARLFRGDARRIEFVTTHSMANGPGDLVRVTYTFVSSRLLYTETPLGYREGLAVPAASEMLGNLSQFDLQYLSEDSGKVAWSNTWSTEGLPLAVHVQIAGDPLTVPMVNRR